MPIRNVADALREMKSGSTHITSRKQAIAVGLKQQRKLGRKRSMRGATLMKGGL